MACAIALAEKKREGEAKKARAADQRATRAALKTRADYIKDAQAAVNAYIRARDAARPCISCGTHSASAWHAGHYRSTGACPELRFEPLNIHKQCAKCNTHLSGNLIGYRHSLIDRIGVDMVEWVEGPHATQKWTIDELMDIKRDFRDRLKQLKKESNEDHG